MPHGARLTWFPKGRELTLCEGEHVLRGLRTTFPRMALAWVTAANIVIGMTPAVFASSGAATAAEGAFPRLHRVGHAGTNNSPK